ncbi:Transcription initiation factor TFIID component TAF4 [Corchorus capsularis]|uniref:Transcription initiation factor TFIID component TAF4 n=1 Tax=Corchorus capsularis TaxID=210143 RepID=A0A1R3H2D5_COCAP|nr:Transcription initiation factor TFIID component TAF4 [Corchorus capsularis]
MSASLLHVLEGGFSTSQPSDSDDQGVWQGSNQSGRQDSKTVDFHSQQSLGSVLPSGSILGNPQRQPNDELHNFSLSEQIAGQTQGMKNSQMNAIPLSESQGSEPQKMDDIPFSRLMPILLPRVDKDKAMQLRNLYAKTKEKVITNKELVKHMKDMVGKAMLESAVMEMRSHSQMDHKSDSHIGVQQIQISSSSSRAMNQERDCSSISGQLQALNKQQKIPFTSHSAADVNSSGSTLKSQPHDSQMMSGPNCQEQNSVDDPIKKHRYIVPGNCRIYKEEDYRKQISVGLGAELQSKSHSSTPQGPFVQGNAILETSKNTTNLMPMNPVSPSLSPQVEHVVPLSSQNSSDNSPAGVKARTPRKRCPAAAGQKKRQKKSLQALSSSPPLPSKKQKVSGAFSDQSIPLVLNHVVNLQEEEEQLFAGLKGESQVSEASRSILHEEERGILLKNPLQKKLSEIMVKHGLKNIGNDVEQCLSLSVEERLRGLICNLIKVSKERADAEKPMHLKHITSDIGQQIKRLNSEAKKEWEKKQVEDEKVQTVLDEPEGTRVHGEKGKNKGQEKPVKKMNDNIDKMRTAAAANVVVRDAVGGEDVLSKWKLMAEQARNKRDAASTSLAGDGTSTKDNRETEKRGPLNPSTSGKLDTP